MKQLSAFILILVALLCGCAKESVYQPADVPNVTMTVSDVTSIGITVPAGSQGEFIFSDQEVCPTGKKITVACGEGLGETEVLLAPVDEILTAGYVNTPIAPGAPATFDTSSGDWLRVGVNVVNDTDTDMTVFVEITGVEVRIA